MVNNSPRVYALIDVDGTLIVDKLGKPLFTWYAILEALGCDLSGSEEINRKYNNARSEKEKREIIKEWLEHDLGLISQKYGDSALKQAMKNIYFTPGAITLVDYLKEHGAEVGLVSAGFPPLVRKIAEKLGVKVDLAIDIEYRDGKFVYKNIVDAEEKAEIVRKLKEEGYYIVYIGDGPNDWKAMEEADLSFCIGKCSSKRAIRVKNLYEVIDVLREKVYREYSKSYN